MMFKKENDTTTELKTDDSKSGSVENLQRQKASSCDSGNLYIYCPILRLLP
jgi:hypothetical protein